MRGKLLIFVTIFLFGFLTSGALTAAVKEKPSKESAYEKCLKFVAHDGVMRVEPDFSKSKFYALSEELAKECQVWGQALDLGEKGILHLRIGNDKASAWISLFNGKEWVSRKFDKAYQGFYKDADGKIRSNVFDLKTGQCTCYEIRVNDKGEIETEVSQNPDGDPSFPIRGDLPVKRIRLPQVIEDKNFDQDVDAKDLAELKKMAEDMEKKAIEMKKILEDRIAEPGCPAIMEGWQNQQGCGVNGKQYTLQRFWETNGVVAEMIKFRVMREGEEKPIAEFEVKQGNEKEGYFSHFPYFQVQPKTEELHLVSVRYRVVDNAAVWDIAFSKDGGKTWETGMNSEWNGRQLIMVIPPKAE